MSHIFHIEESADGARLFWDFGIHALEPAEAIRTYIESATDKTATAAFLICHPGANPRGSWRYQAGVGADRSDEIR